MTLGDNNHCLEELKRVGLDRCGYENGVWSFCNGLTTVPICIQYDLDEYFNVIRITTCGMPSRRELPICIYIGSTVPFQGMNADAQSALPVVSVVLLEWQYDAACLTAFVAS